MTRPERFLSSNPAPIRGLAHQVLGAAGSFGTAPGCMTSRAQVQLRATTQEEHAPHPDRKRRRRKNYYQKCLKAHKDGRQRSTLRIILEPWCRAVGRTSPGADLPVSAFVTIRDAVWSLRPYLTASEPHRQRDGGTSPQPSRGSSPTGPGRPAFASLRRSARAATRQTASSRRSLFLACRRAQAPRGLPAARSRCMANMGSITLHISWRTNFYRVTGGPPPMLPVTPDAISGFPEEMEI